MTKEEILKEIQWRSKRLEKLKDEIITEQSQINDLKIQLKIIHEQ